MCVQVGTLGGGKKVKFHNNNDFMLYLLIISTESRKKYQNLNLNKTIINIDHILLISTYFILKRRSDIVHWEKN